MPDFGTVLPFQTVATPEANAWCVHMLEIAPEEISTCDGKPVKLEEAWGYFVWLPQGIAKRDFSQPELWGVTRWVPYEQVYSLVEKQSVHFLPNTPQSAVTLGVFLLRHAQLSPRERERLTRKVLCAQSGDELQRLRSFTRTLIQG
jgi:hypothetical protein